MDKVWPCVAAWAQVKVESDTGPMVHRHNNSQRRRETMRLQNAEAAAIAAERSARAARESAREAETAQKAAEEQKKLAQDATKRLYEIAKDAKEAEKKAMEEASDVKQRMEEVRTLAEDAQKAEKKAMEEASEMKQQMEEVKTQAKDVEEKMLQAEAALMLAVTVEEALGFPNLKDNMLLAIMFFFKWMFCLPFFAGELQEEAKKGGGKKFRCAASMWFGLLFGGRKQNQNLQRNKAGPPWSPQIALKTLDCI